MKPEPTRERIRAAATRILVQEGLSGLSMRRIGEAVGLSQAALYRHFANKAELVGSLVGSGYADLVARLIRANEGAKSPSEKIDRTIEAYVEFALSSPDLFKAVLLRDAGPARERINSLRPGISQTRESFALLVSVIREGMESGEFAPADPELTAQALWTALFGLAARLVIEGNVDDGHRKALVLRHKEIIIRGLRP